MRRFVLEMRIRSPPSQLGGSQFQRPRSFMLAGTSTLRTIVASMRSAVPTPNPTCWISASYPVAHPTKTAMMINAAPVITRAVVARE